MMERPDRGIEKELAALRATLRRLRRPGGCPWDREQDLDDMISYLIEESYELLHAERTKNWRSAEEELGDVLFILVFIHELLLRKRRTPLAAIVAGVHAKIVNRHPHVFGTARAANSVQSLAEWERVKRSEKGRRSPRRLLDEVPGKLPPLRRATLVQRKAAGVGFDWPDHRGILDKLREETAELEREIRRGSRARIKDEVGDILFTVVNLARALRVDPESVLEGTTTKFVGRFTAVEDAARRRGRTLSSMSLDEMERLWQRAKRAKQKKRGAIPRPPLIRNT
jgi:MazG family protein